jgi:DNA-binding GntR family transcriptional regulator
MYALQQEDLSHKAYHAIKQMILRGAFSPGEKLFQEKLAEELGISRTPLNSALNQLEKELLVEALPRRGFFVKQLSLKELQDLYDIRLRLEPLGAKEAAENSTETQKERCRALLATYQKKENNAASDAFREFDYQFHNLVMEMSNNFFLQKMISSFNIISLGNLQLFMKQEDFPKKTSTSLKEHITILNAILDKEPEKAEKAMYSHIEETRNLIAQRLGNSSHEQA